MYWLRKFFAMLLTLGLVTMATFFTFYLLPGDPAALILGTEADPEALELLRSQLGLDRPLLAQYSSWLQGVLRGDLGSSITFSRGYPVSSLILDALPVTIPLALLSIGISLALGVVLGTVAAVNRGAGSFIIQYLSQLSLSLPAFWLGILLIQWLAVGLGWFPPSGIPRWSADPAGAMLSLVLPAITLSLPRTAVLTRTVRSALQETLREDYIRTARSKGLPEKTVIFSHALRNALVSVSTVTGIQLIQLIAGTIVVEQVFSLPGLGRLMLAAVLLRDLPLVQGTVFVGAALIIVVNFLLDSLYPWLDPRVRVER
ncbi:MAG: ABC transporter permease [Firmicutes bacterium]|nr:ABC transporter permease [Bacillota bacterium]